MRAVLSCVFLILPAGCTSSPDARQGDDQTDVITREQIVETGAPTIYELVKRLCPGWLPWRPGTFIDVRYFDEEGHLDYGVEGFLGADRIGAG